MNIVTIAVIFHATFVINTYIQEQLQETMTPDMIRTGVTLFHQ